MDQNRNILATILHQKMKELNLINEFRSDNDELVGISLDNNFLQQELITLLAYNDSDITLALYYIAAEEFGARNIVLGKISHGYIKNVGEKGKGYIEKTERNGKIYLVWKEGYKPWEKEGCFIATACYGSYHHMDVIVLRKFRDQFLKGSYIGEGMIKLYYFFGEPLAKILFYCPFIVKEFVRLFFVKPIYIISLVILKFSGHKIIGINKERFNENR